MGTIELAKLRGDSGDLYKVRQYTGSGFMASGSDFSRPARLMAFDKDSKDWNQIDEWDGTLGKGIDAHPDKHIKKAKERLKKIFGEDDVDVIERTDAYERKKKRLDEVV